MSLLSTLTAVEFKPFVQYWIVSTKVGMNDPETTRVKTEDEAKALIDAFASNPATQYIVIKAMWETDVTHNRRLDEYVASRKNGGLTTDGNGNPVIKWSAKDSKVLPPYNFNAARNDESGVTHEDSPFS